MYCRGDEGAECCMKNDKQLNCKSKRTVKDRNQNDSKNILQKQNDVLLLFYFIFISFLYILFIDISYCLTSLSSKSSQVILSISNTESTVNKIISTKNSIFFSRCLSIY
jgi:hypothetical protein